LRRAADDCACFSASLKDYLNWLPTVGSMDGKNPEDIVRLTRGGRDMIVGEIEKLVRRLEQ
jgi:hypothetical protein